MREPDDGSSVMQNSYLEHPAEEALERFLLHQSPEDELEVVETHILGCDTCVARLESLETQITVMKTALRELQQQTAAAAAGVQPRSWKSWFTVPHLSWAGAAAAALVAGLVITPQIAHRATPAVDVSLSAYRGVESAAVPEGRSLNVHLNAADLPAGPVVVQLVDYTGNEVWKTSSSVRDDQVNVKAPKISHAGPYFFRLYAPGRQGQQGELLREFSFQAK
jgi:anti-sigma factor RsiW